MTAPEPKKRDPLFSDLLSEYEHVSDPRDWFAEGAIEGDPLFVFAGPEKSHKSWILIDLVVSTVTGSRWLGAFPIKRPGTAFYVDCEYGPFEFARRAARIARAKGFDPREVLPGIKHVWGTGFEMRDGNQLALDVFHRAQREPPSLIVLDPWRNVLGGDENSAQDVIGTLKHFGLLRDRVRCPVGIAHHLNRAGTVSGSRALMGRADLLIEGTDDEQPWYATRGRTIRRNDPIGRRFTVTVAHEDDEDDRVAKTCIGLRFEGDPVAKTALRKASLRVLEVLRRDARPMTKNALREAINANNVTISAALEELSAASLVTFDHNRWSASTQSVFETAFGEAQRARDEGRAPPVEAQPEHFVRPVSQKRMRRT
jgi:hypothetical protein